MSRLILIHGGSCAGKSTFSQELKTYLEDHNTSCHILPTDLFYFEPRKNTPLIDHNFDSREAFDKDKLLRVCNAAMSRSETEFSAFEFSTHRCSRSIAVGIADVLIIEGIFSFLVEDLLKMCDLAIFIEAEERLMFERRYKRYFNELKQPKEFIIYKYYQQSLPFYKREILPLKERADIILNGENPFHKPIEVIGSYLLKTTKT